MLKIAFRALARLPLWALHAFGNVVGWLFTVLPNPLRRNARVNIALCYPELQPSDRRRLLRRSLCETAKTLMEVGRFWYGRTDTLENLIREVRGLDVLKALLARNRGLLVAVPHLGAWELMGLYWARRHPLNSLYRPPRKGVLEPLLLEVRQRTGARLLPATPKGIRALYQALQRGELAAILPDQEPKTSYRLAPFFNVPARTTTLLPKMAHRSGAPVLFAFAERLPRARGYRIHLIEAPPGIDDDDPEVGAAALNRGVEACIRICPAQYQWTYKRFRHAPLPGGNPYEKAP